MLLFVISRQQSGGEKLDEEKLVNSLFLKLGQSQSEFVERIMDKMNLNQRSQIEALNNYENKLETNFLTLKSEQKLMLSQQSSNLEIQFQKMQENNQQRLAGIQNSIQERLAQSIQNLVEINNKNFELLNKTNQQRLDQINLDVQKKLDENFARNLKSFEEVTKNLGQMEQKAQQMIESTKSVEKLNTIFSRTSSKAFGGFAENYLESLLEENLAKDSWDKQIKVPNSNEIIDFVIYVDDRKIGIDAKFPLTKYQDYIEAEIGEREGKRKEFLRAVMAMAKEIGEKYYKNNFVDSLFLYLPSESLYNEVLDTEKNQEVLEFLRKQKVSIISPNTIFPQIMLIKAYQFRLEISENAENIVLGLKQIQKNIDSFKNEYRKLGDKIRQAQINYDQAEKNLLGVERNILLLDQNAGQKTEPEAEALVE
jgi:DNA recombination protein RmuC